MPNTPQGYPYPAPDDAITDYPAQAQQLAEKLDGGPISTGGDIYARKGAAAHVQIGGTTGLPAIWLGPGNGEYFYGATAPSRMVTDSDVIIQGMRAHRHPYGAPRHIEGGIVFCGNLATAQKQPVSIAFTDPFVAEPSMALGAINTVDPSGVNTPGLSPALAWSMLTGNAGSGMIYGANGSNSNPSPIYVSWVAEGPD